MPRPADLEAPGGVTTIELIAAPAAVAEWFGNVSKRVAARKTLPVGGWARRHFGIHLLAEQIRRIRDRCEDSGWIMQ